VSCRNKKTDKSLTTEKNKIEIIETPLNYSKERERLSLDYLEKRHNLKQSFPSIKPVMIVLHFTDGGTAKSNYDYFNKDEIETARTFNRSKSLLNVSSHYLIDRNGTIYHLVPDTLFARHIIGLNYCAIGIENTGSGKEPLTEQQVIANARLVRYLCKKYEIKYLIGHSEYGVFRNSSLWKETDPAYFTVKDDPGIKFMKKLREVLSDMDLKSSPE
jgi:N-acetyl-anhydromuramyl-L-alanine amidase AmpD